jgi:hypothetical protein
MRLAFLFGMPHSIQQQLLLSSMLSSKDVAELACLIAYIPFRSNDF